jgi:hypothetical protein
MSPITSPLTSPITSPKKSPRKLFNIPLKSIIDSKDSNNIIKQDQDDIEDNVEKLLRKNRRKWEILKSLDDSNKNNDNNDLLNLAIDKMNNVQSRATTADSTMTRPNTVISDSKLMEVNKDTPLFLVNRPRSSDGNSHKKNSKLISAGRSVVNADNWDE